MKFIEYRLVEHRNPKTSFMESWIYREARPGEWFVARAVAHAEFRRFQPSRRGPAEPWIPSHTVKANLAPGLDALIARDELVKLKPEKKP